MRQKEIRGAELIRRGVKLGRHGEIEHGILCLLEGLSLIDERESARLALSGYHNLALLLTHRRLTILARAVVVRARRLYRQVGDPVMETRLVWLKGTLARLSGNPHLAARRLRQAVEMFRSLDQDDQAALAREELMEMELRLAAQHKAAG